ncbi:MAG TPA: hypothetical protein VFN61_05010 [Acidimicrobiales bacterium]|nr:hypothetical protein [Acidimicrobiales bacterium]
MNKLIHKGGIALSAMAIAASVPATVSLPASAAPVRSAGASAAALTNTPAAQLYAALDALLREHADLTATVVQTAITAGPSSASTKAALGALDQNTQALGGAIGSYYGAAAKASFLKLWRAHIGFFVDYTLGVAGHDQMKIAAAQKELNGYISQFSAFVHGATNLPTSAVAADLRGHVSTLEAAINAIVSKSPRAGTLIDMAAMHMDGTAQVLAEGIASVKHVSGSVTGAGASLRAALTGLLVQHVADTGFVVQTAVANHGSLTAPEVKGAIAALSANTNALGGAIGHYYGTAAEAAFLKTWRAHIGFFVNYTLGVATHDNAKVAMAQQDLNGYISSFSAFLSGATKLPRAAVAADLKGHVTTLEAAINAIVSASPDAAQKLLMAEGHMAGTGAVLAQGIASSEPSKVTS